MDITPDDMSDFIRFFRIPTKLYEQVSNYAEINKLTIKSAMANLLHIAHKQLLKKYYFYYLANYKNNYIDITEDWHVKRPQIVKKGFAKQFVLTFIPELKKEIFEIFIYTNYKAGTPEMNVEICARLAYGLTLINKN